MRITNMFRGKCLRYYGLFISLRIRKNKRGASSRPSEECFVFVTDTHMASRTSHYYNRRPQHMCPPIQTEIIFVVRLFYSPLCDFLDTFTFIVNNVRFILRAE